MTAWEAERRKEDVERLYGLLKGLRQALDREWHLGDCHRGVVPRGGGVYFLFEPGETRVGPQGVPRVVRVGAGSSLWERLKKHIGRRDGFGNHRPSILRKHAGIAMLNRAGRRHDLPTWGVGDHAPAHVHEQERWLEVTVSRHVWAMPVLWLAVDEAPGQAAHRERIEENAIALLSSQYHPLDPPSNDWLGQWSESKHCAIQRSGLWNVKCTDHPYRRDFLDLMDKYVSATVTSARG